MRIIHRIVKSIDSAMAKQLRSLGFEVEPGFMVILVDEMHSSWPQLQRLVKEWEMSDVIETKFSKADLDRAEYIELGTTWHHGYPMPDDDFGYLDFTYDSRIRCRKCYCGERQKAPFRMKAEPKWGSKYILQLNWVFDEYFVRPETWETVFKPFGISCRPAVKHKTGEVLKTVVQLEITQVAPCPLMLDAAHEYAQCAECGTKKYIPHRRGPFPRLQRKVSADMFKTQEYFGSGGSAWRAVIISAKLYAAMRDAQVKGAYYEPLKST